jgi:hypothetical protein
MIDFKKDTEHAIKRLRFEKGSTIYDIDIEFLFGKVPDNSLHLLPISGILWNRVFPLIDWILNNTEYKVVGVNEDSYCFTIYFTK